MYVLTGNNESKDLCCKTGSTWQIVDLKHFNYSMVNKGDFY